MIASSTQERAQRSPHTHSFRPGTGYVDHGREPELANSVKNAAPCAPVGPSLPGTIHVLKPAGGGTIEMRWTGKFWESPHSPSKGNRIAFTPDYLGRAGWSYLKPAE